MRLPALLLVVALPGCFGFGHCGLHPEWVEWREAGFDETLRNASAPGWTVRVVEAPPGLPYEDATLAAWNASVQRAVRDLGWHVDLTLQSGTLWLHGVVDEVPPGLPDRVEAALGEVTDANATQRRAWTEQLLAEPDMVGQGREGSGSTRHLSFRMDLPAQNVRVSGLLDDVPEERPGRIVAGDWSMELSYPTVEATQGTRTFTADVHGTNTFTDAAWEGEFPQEEALADFRAAYASLGVGDPTANAQVSGAIC